MNPATGPTDPPGPLPAAAPSRRMLMAGVAAVAGLAGAGVAWWRLRPAGSDAATALPEGFWAQSFDAPAGPPVSMAALKGRPLLLNFWATWCPPCIEELPLLDRFQRENAAKGWQVLGLAIDTPSAVRAFLQRTPLGFPVGLAGLAGTELTRSLGNQVGGLPFSVLVGAGGGVLARRMGRLTEADLAQWLQLR